MNSNYLWYDLETFGSNPWRDRIAQFAAIRTDSEFNILDQYNFYCQPPADRLPNVDACFITGITPQFAQQQGLSETKFADKVAQIFAQGNSCRVGYNSLRFDDEMCRSLFYRNFINVYDSEWRNGNSRWDLLDVVRLVYATKPETLNWPKNEDGNPLFKLELLAKTNNLAAKIKDYNAHEALSDIKVTIELAKLIQQRQPKLYQYCRSNYKKQQLQELLKEFGDKEFLHISGRYPAETGCASLVFCLGKHPKIANQYLIADLREDPNYWLDFSQEQLQQCLYTPRTELLQKKLKRLPIKTINLSHCPILVTANILNSNLCSHLQIDKNVCKQNLQHWQSQKIHKLIDKITAIFALPFTGNSNDPESMLYQKFISDDDQEQFCNIRTGNFEDVTLIDQRLQKLLLRYKANNFANSLSASDLLKWRQYCQQNIINGGENLLSIKQYNQRLQELANDDTTDKTILKQLKAWGNHLSKQFTK